jgi:hypothetical protein
VAGTVKQYGVERPLEDDGHVSALHPQFGLDARHAQL